MLQVYIINERIQKWYCLREGGGRGGGYASIKPPPLPIFQAGSDTFWHVILWLSLKKGKSRPHPFPMDPLI